jgi:hypothetical protein
LAVVRAHLASTEAILNGQGASAPSVYFDVYKRAGLMNDAGDSDDLAVLFRLHAGLEGLACEIAQGDPNDHLCPSAAGQVGHLLKMLASFAAL